MQEENWLPLINYQDHEISDWGRIRRADGHIYTTNRNGNNQSASIIYLSDKKRKTIMIARTVLIYFKKAIKPKIEYIDGNCMNCKLDNLKYSEFSLGTTRKPKNKSKNTCKDCIKYPCIFGRTPSYIQPTHYATFCFSFKLKK